MSFEKRLFKTHSGAWTWSFVDEAAWRDLAPSPEIPPNDAATVKSNPVRTVFRKGQYFIKVERPEPLFGFAALKALFRPKAKSEFLSLQAMAEAGVPAVEPVAYGSAGANQALVTRAFEGAVSAQEYFCANFVEAGIDPEIFLERWTAFIRLVLASGFEHPDFHNGNILYSPSAGEFKLVDVFGVKRKLRPALDQMRRIVLGMRRGLPPERLLKLAFDCGAENPEAFVERGLEEEARRLERDWPKREAQLLAGYRKFSARGRSGVLFLLDSAGRPLADAESLEDGSFEKVVGQNALIEPFHLELAGIPHRRAVAYDPATGTVYREQPGSPASPSGKELQNFKFYAKHFNIDAEACLFSRDVHGRLSIMKAKFGETR